MSVKIPIFVITCDRLVVLRESLASYRECIKTPFEPIMVDFGSTYKPMVSFLGRLESRGIKVYWMNKIDQPGELNQVNICIQDYFKTHPKSDYVVTDPDIALDNTRGDVLHVYRRFLKINPAAHVVGPMLRIDDIPDYYPLKEALISGELGLHKKFHSQPIQTIMYRRRKIYYITAPIDTTFGMYRAGTTWKRCRHGIRVLAPYAARHLDWYLDFDNLTPDQDYYTEHAAPTIIHWSKWRKERG